MGWKTTECSPNPGALTIRNPYLAAALFLIPRSFPLRSACNGWCSLPSFPTVPRGSKRLLRKRKSMLCCILFWERKHLNDTIVAVTATFSWLITKPTPVLDLHWECTSELPLSYIYWSNKNKNQLWNSTGSCLLSKHCMLNISVIFSQLWLCWVATLMLKTKLETLVFCQHGYRRVVCWGILV